MSEWSEWYGALAQSLDERWHVVLHHPVEDSFTRPGRWDGPDGTEFFAAFSTPEEALDHAEAHGWDVRRLRRDLIAESQRPDWMPPFPRSDEWRLTRRQKRRV